MSKKALKASAMAKALTADRCPLEAVARQMGVSEDALVRAILEVIRERFDAAHSPPTSSSIH